MAFEKKTFAPESVANARWLYEETEAPLQEVAGLLGITRSTLASRIIEWGWAPRKATKITGPACRKSPHGVRANKALSQRAKRANAKRANLKREKARPKKASPRKQKPEKSFAEAKTLKPLPGNVMAPAALAVRVQRVVERELDAIDQILGAIGAADAAEAERSARTLASLARALKEVMRLAAPDEAADADDDDPVPRDLDEFRRELARRIEALAAGGAAETAGDGG